MFRHLVLLAVILAFALPAVSQITDSSPKARVFITDSQSWETSGSAGGTNGTFAAHSQGGARPQTAEIIKTFGERCPDIVVNNKAEKANYVVLLDHEGAKGYARRDNKVAVFNSDGDSILSHSTRTLGNAVKDACEAITKDWPTRAGKAGEAKDTPKLTDTANRVSELAQVPPQTKISVSSSPAGADIELDGSFVGNTPSAINTSTGEHSVVVKKSGYKPWERKIKITGGDINISAELEKTE